MFDSISASAASGLAAAARRAEATASNLADTSLQNSLPVGQAANSNATGDVPEKFVPLRVEQSSTSDGGTAIKEWPIRPPNVVLAEQLGRSQTEYTPPVAEKVDRARELQNLAEATRSFEASARSLQSVQDRVRDLYDLAK